MLHVDYVHQEATTTRQEAVLNLNVNYVRLVLIVQLKEESLQSSVCCAQVGSMYPPWGVLTSINV